jgi:DNA-binding NarL/FixJ family response regulator
MKSQIGPLRAVVLDPHPIWLDAVEIVLARIGVTVVRKTSSGQEALATIKASKPGLLILELDPLPGEPDGFEVIRHARALVPSLRAIALSTHHDTAHIDGALAAGAAAYVLKTADPDDVASAVRQAFEHSVHLAGAPGPDVEAVAPPASVASTAPGGLTRRELEILRLVAEGHSNSQLAGMLWVTEQTVKFHLSNIYRKLGVANRTEASRWAQRHGLLTETSEESSVSA